MFEIGYQPNLFPSKKDHCYLFNSKSEVLVPDDQPLNGLTWERVTDHVSIADSVAPEGLTFFHLGTIEPGSVPAVNAWLLRIGKVPNPLLEPMAGTHWVGVRILLRDEPAELMVPWFRALHVNSWLDRYRHCPHCGRQLGFSVTELAQDCTDCQMSFYPTISPAIIVAITRKAGTELLLAVSKNRTGNWYSLIAGYCEAGESIEATVAREVMEETNLKVRNIQYELSQGWPFSQSLMLGFTAEYESGELIHEPDELDGAGWFGLDNLPPIPPRPSLAHTLIDLVLNRFLNEKSRLV